MYKNQHISVVIPALNEEQAIVKVISELKDQLSPDCDALIDDIVVCDNGSTDATAELATRHGASVVCQTQKGYGIACLTAIAALKKTDIVLFVDADDSNRASQAIDLIQALVDTNIDLVIGSRTMGQAEPGAQTTPQLFGNWLTAKLVKLIWNYEITDLGPYRAIRYRALKQLEMQDESFGWTIEMQVKAIQQGLRMTEIPVDSTQRIGVSKISGTFWGVIGAGKGILGKIAVLWWRGRKELHAIKVV